MTTFNKILASNYFFYAFVSLGCILQLLAYEKGMELSLISGLCGVISVVLISRRKMSQFLFGFIQLGTYFVLSWNERLWGEVGTTIFYIVTLACALFVWSKNREGAVVKSRTLKIKTNILVGAITFLGILGMWKILATTTDSQPFMDAFTTVPAVTAQLLMTFRYREQWIYWIIINFSSLVMWSIAGDFNMMAQFGFWALNCLYGWMLWKE